VRRRLFNVAGFASLALCIGLSVLWIRSYFRCDVVFVEERGEGPPIDPQFRRALVIYQQYRWGKPPDLYFQFTRHELHLSRGRFAIGTYIDRCIPERPRVSLTPVTGPRLGYRSQESRALPPLINKECAEVTGWLDYGWSLTLQPSWPLWMVYAPTLVLPLWWLGWRWREQRRQRRGLCRACGYDLRATPDRCPECGSQPAATIPT
jgi:hypothetical protein